MKPRETLSRRKALGVLAGGTGALLAPGLLSRPVEGSSERVRLGVIGTGGRAQQHLRLLKEIGETEVVALCDVYQPRLAAVSRLTGGTPELLGDFRRLLERKDVDAVLIATPDHWHCAMVSAAVEAGKDVYVEKPLSRSIDEGARTVALVRASRRIVQVGMQQRSWAHFIRARDLVREGKLGKINLVLCHWYQAYPREMPQLEIDLPRLNWKAFLGSAPERPFDPARYRFWRFYWDYAGGILTDLLTHWIDVVQWALEDDTPRSATAAGERASLPYFETPDTVSASLLYPKGFLVTYSGTMNCALTGGGIVFRGERGYLELNRDRLALFPEGVKPAEHTSFPDPELLLTSDHDGTRDHLKNFLDCVRSRKEPNAPIEAGHAAARASHLANLALRERKTVQWDAAGARAVL